jgi:hypothetical protein
VEFGEAGQVEGGRMQQFAVLEDAQLTYAATSGYMREHPALDRTTYENDEQAPR